MDTRTEGFTAIGAVGFGSFEWNLWSCDHCGSIVEWADLEVHEEFHDPHTHPSGLTKLLLALALLLGIVGLLD